jgi:hypothetical protein
VLADGEQMKQNRGCHRHCCCRRQSKCTKPFFKKWFFDRDKELFFMTSLVRQPLISDVELSLSMTSR